MDCLKGLLSLSKYCGLPDPIIKDGYVSLLPGISTEIVQKITDAERPTFFDLWEKVETQGASELKEAVLSILSETVNFNESQYQTLKPVLDMVTAPALPAVEERGVKIELPEGKHVRLYLKGVWIHSVSEAVTTLKVIDAHTLEELYSEQINLEAGLKHYEIEQEFEAKQLFISIDATEVESRYFTYDNYSYPHGFSPCQQNCCYNQNDLYIIPAINNSITGFNLGLYPDAEIICSIESFICEHKRKFGQVLKYKYGEKLMQEKRASHRLNVFTSTNLEFTQERENEFKEEFLKTLRSTLKRINLTAEGSCFDCSDNYEITTGSMMP